MTLAHGRPILAIPGPSVMPDRVLSAMHRAAPNIYEGALPDMMPALIADLKAVARSSGHVAIYIGNGHAAWEAANMNLFSRGDGALGLVTGRFGENWAAEARAVGVDVQTIDFGRRGPVDADQVETVLRADHAGHIKTVLLTHVDTATSVRNDVAAVRAAIDAAGHRALLAVDCIASLACDDFRFDEWGVDVMVAASQKGLMVPPGLGLVWVSERARHACAGSDLRTPYWDWTGRLKPDFFYEYFHGTAPTHHLFGLRTALDMILREEGLDAVITRHGVLARAVWAGLAHLGSRGSLRFNIEDPAHRSHAVTGLRIDAPDARRLREWTETMAGVTLGIGLGMAAPGSPEAHGFFRIGHMGHLNLHMVLGTLGVIEAGMAALGIPHAPGAASAAAAAAAAEAGPGPIV
jgi:alanine-glyoxylate transaminase/serine-glyoxylate transaminase/serine-pyruvate transaminase